MEQTEGSYVVMMHILIIWLLAASHAHDYDYCMPIIIMITTYYVNQSPFYGYVGAVDDGLKYYVCSV